jgi:4-hydroxy-3-methylbut-2-en-1-yl diphosphate synthase IspG/GcpE
MDSKPKMSIEDAIERLNDLNYSIGIQVGSMEDKVIRELQIAIAMGVSALRKTTINEIYDFSDRSQS